ncbi:MAG: hypothetical protein J6F30_14740 [Cellulosilyticum sp.]|nr:hypothetical protein [Cellulosilyticum sp.]
MKKKLLALVATLCMAFSLVGCASEGMVLMKEFEEVAKWEAAEQSGTMGVEIQVEGEKVELSADYSAYTVTDTLQMEMTVSPKQLKMEGVAVDLTKGDYKISPIKMYLDGTKAYISSTYFTDLLRISGVDATTAMTGIDLSKDYICMDLTSIYTQMGIDVKDLAASNQKMTKDFYTQLGAADINCNMKQEGRKYTIELTADQMIDAAAQVIVQSMEVSKDMLVAEYKAMGLTDAQIDLVMAQVKAMTSPEALAPFAEMIKGSTVKATFAYEDGKQTSEYAMNINVAIDETETVSFKLTMKDEAKKAEAKAITMPTSVAVYTMDDLMAIGATTEAETTEAETTEAAEAVTEKAA